LERGEIVQDRTVKVVMTLLIVASLILALVPLAMSKGMNAQGWKGKGERLKNIDEVYESIAYMGTKDGVTTLNILNAAIKDKSGNVTMMNITKPIPVQFYSSNNTAVLPKMDKMVNKTAGKHKRPMRTDYNSATINPAGASGVVALKNINMLKVDNNTAEFQFTAVSVYLPDGTVKHYTFATPVKVVKSWKDRTAKIDNPAVVADLQDALKGGAKFPANAAPVPLKTIDTK
jgi:hypothetical protein